MSKNQEDRPYQSLSRTRTEAGKKVIEFIDLKIYVDIFFKNKHLCSQTFEFYQNFRPVVCLFVYCFIFSCFCVLYNIFGTFKYVLYTCF